MHPLLKFLLDFLPLGGFFLGYHFFNLYIGTAVIIVLTLITLAISWVIEKKIAMLPLISGCFITVFGILTLAMHDEWFIKIRPTVVNLLFAAILLGGVYIGKKGFMRYLFDMAFSLNDAGWLKLSRNWGFFFVFLAAANEVVWRHFSTDFWVNYKVFGVMAMTFIFTILNVIAMKSFHEQPSPPE